MISQKCLDFPKTGDRSYFGENRFRFIYNNSRCNNPVLLQTLINDGYNFQIGMFHKSYLQPKHSTQYLISLTSYEVTTKVTTLCNISIWLFFLTGRWTLRLSTNFAIYKIFKNHKLHRRVFLIVIYINKISLIN